MSADYDSPWKEALDAYFEAFLALLFPDAYALIDWSRGYESLDKQFPPLPLGEGPGVRVVREAELGRRYVDKLVKVWTKEGVECWVLIHIEVQTTRDTDFPLRMYVYNYRIFDRYNKPVASLAVLADDDANWRPAEFRESIFGCETGIRFPAVKLLDFAKDEAALEANANPFAQVVLAHLKARETQREPAERHVWKLRLVRGLYERGFSAGDMRKLFRLINWLMELPPPLEYVFLEEVQNIQKERTMPYITGYERAERGIGLRMGIESLLRVRFGDEGLKLVAEIGRIYDMEQLQAILKAIETAVSPDEVRRLWTPGDP